MNAFALHLMVYGSVAAFPAFNDATTACLFSQVDPESTIVLVEDPGRAVAVAVGWKQESRELGRKPMPDAAS
jgi:hypothetical protein